MHPINESNHRTNLITSLHSSTISHHLFRFHQPLLTQQPLLSHSSTLASAVPVLRPRSSLPRSATASPTNFTKNWDFSALQLSISPFICYYGWQSSDIKYITICILILWHRVWLIGRRVCFLITMGWTMLLGKIYVVKNKHYDRNCHWWYGFLSASVVTQFSLLWFICQQFMMRDKDGWRKYVHDGNTTLNTSYLLIL